MPMSDRELAAYFERLRLSPLAQDLISSARRQAPSRRISPAGSNNVPIRYASVKMGLTIGQESSEENIYAALCEYDDDVLEYWEQPLTAHLLITARNGHARRVPYHVDFLVLRRERIELVQVKTQQNYDALPSENPHRWSLIDGRVRDVAADAYFGDCGLRHEIVCDGQLNKVRADNCLLLLRAVEQPVAGGLERLTQRVVAHLEEMAVSTIASLLDAIGTKDATTVYQMVHAKAIAADLDSCRLVKIDECPVALDHKTLERYLATVAWRGRSSPPAWPHLAPKEALEAHARLQQLRQESSPERSSRTLRRWRSRLAQNNQDPFCLAPRTRLRGNRLCRLSPTQIDLVERAISAYYLTALSPTVRSCYGQYRLDVGLQKKAGLIPRSAEPVSYKTFCKFCRRRDPEASAMARGGRRLANAHRAPVAPELKSLKPLRPFERAHIDHYTCDLHVVVAPEVKGGTKRPWLTLLRDEFTGAVLAMSLSFLSPSRRSCMSVIRDCVRRHQRLPETITVDNGKEFESTYFELLLAHYRVSKQSRPPGAPRFGASVERAFGSLKSFLSGLPGNTTNDARGRSASPAFRGQQHAALGIHDAYAAIESYFFEHFNQHPLSNQLHSPQHLLNSTLERFPFSGLRVAFDEILFAKTALPIGRLKFDPSRGIRHADRWYSTAALMRTRSGSVEAFEEPWDISRLYVLTEGKLVTCVHGPTEPGPLYSAQRTLDSILALECADVIARLKNSKVTDMAKLTRSTIQSGRRPPPPIDRPATSQELPPLADAIAQLEVVLGDEHA